MNYRTLLVLVIVSVWPFVGRAEEPTFFSHQGKYTISPEVAMNISPEESSHLLRATLTFTRGGSSGVTLKSAHADEPFVAYWDAATQTLWWGTSQCIGNLDVHQPQSSNGFTRARSTGVRDDQTPNIPAVFVTELARRIPIHP